MSCMFRVSGENLEIGKLLKEVPLEPHRVWIKGKPRFKSNPNSRVVETSGAAFIVSNADMAEFEAQIKEAAAFLKVNMAQIKQMVSFEGVSEATFDFGIELRDVAIHCDYLSPEFLGYIAEAGIGVELSHYPCSEE